MSSAENKAVFLSYASQDAEAATRVVAALRAAGVEVWFDQNELVGGDAWDQKIRGQIKACALFVPVISAATQARREGYFRLEWKLAAQRTHMISERQAFLLPVVIDATSDAAADVPEEFRAVQWTRLPGGEGVAVEKFCARVGKLLGGSDVARAFQPVSAPKPDTGWKARVTPEVGRRVPAAAWAALAVVALAAVVWWAQRRNETVTPANAGAGTRPPTTEKTAAPLSEASRLVAKAWEQMDKTEMARNELLLAEGFCRQAAASDESNPAVWAAWSAMNTWYFFHDFERSPARKEAARDYAQKALALDPKSYDARYAWGHFIVRLRAEGNIGDERPALPILRELLRERPDEPRALYALGFGLIADPANADEGFSLLERLAEKHPWFAGRALNEVGWMSLFYGRFGVAESAAERAVKARPYWNNLGLKATLALRLHGDVELAQATIDRLPPTALQENWGISLAVMVADWREDHARAVSILQGASRDWLENFFYFGPTSFLSGQMRLKAKQVTAAEKDFRRALELITPRLEKTPNDIALLYYKAEAQRLLGMREEADRTYRQVREVWPDTFASLAFEPPEQALDYVRRMVDRDHAIFYFPANWWFTAASLRLDPLLENVRRAPGFKALLGEVEQREKQRWLQTSPAGGTKTTAVTSEKAEVPGKSVAVLAFANVGGDKENEIFSDGISEELINVLGRVSGLTVKGRASSFFFKGSTATAQEKGQRLGATYLVDGSVRRQGSAVRITAQVSRAATDEVVWTSEPLVRELKDMWAVQEEIAGLIAKALSLKLGVASAAAKTEVDPEAFRLYIEGRREWNRRLPAGYARAEQLLTRAIQLAPGFAQAHAALADVWELQGEWDNELGPYNQRDGALAQRVRAKAREALALDPQCAEAHASLGLIGWNSWRFAEGEEALRTALRINPSYASAHQWLGRNLMLQGRLDEALVALRRAADLDPLSPRILDNVAWALVHAGRPDEALAALDRALALQPDAVQATSIKAQILARRGRRDEAMALVKALPAGVWISSHWRVTALGVMGDAEARSLIEGHLNDRNAVTRFTALLGLGREEEALRTIVPGQIEATRADVLLFDPIYDRVRVDARFRQALATIGLTDAHARAQAWRAQQAKAR